MTKKRTRTTSEEIDKQNLNFKKGRPGCKCSWAKRDNIKTELENIKLRKELSENSLKEKYETQIADRDDAVKT